MAVDKFAKHRKSREMTWVVRDKAGKIIFSADNEKDFLLERSEYLKKKKIKHKTRTKIK